MAAHKVTPVQVNPSRPSSRHGRNQYRDTPVDRQAIIDTYTQAPSLTHTQIAKLHDCDRTTVSKILSKYAIDHAELEEFKAHRADILAGLQRKIALAITDDEIKKAPAQVKSMMFGVFYDKERLERGQATDITVNFDAVRAIQERRAELERRIRELTGGARPQDIVLDAETADNIRDNVSGANKAEAKLPENTRENECTSDNMHYVNLRENVSGDDVGAASGSSSSDVHASPRPAPRRGRPRKAR